jgi:hypothetical protein
MQFKRSFSRLAATAAATLFIAAVAFARGHDHAQMQGQAQGKAQAIKVGKRGEITLTQPTKVGSIVLQPDTYVVQHRVSGSDHFVRFVELKQVEAEQSGTEGGHYTYTEHNKAGEIPCRIEPVPSPIKKTTVYTEPDDGTPRITKVVIKGENVAHIL